MTLTRKIVLAVGLAMVIPAMTYQGIEMVHPKPTVQQYLLHPGWRTAQAAEEALRLRTEQNQLQEKLKTEREKWAKAHFWVAVTLGVALTLLGAFSPVPGIGGGVMVGGALTFLQGMYLGELGRVASFLTLSIAFVVLLWIGLKGFRQMRQVTPSSAA